MQMISEVMTRNVQFITPQENLQRAAQMMDELNVGALPVCDDGRLIGMVTDRDITVRATAAGRVPTEACVAEVMSGDVRWCFEDESVDDVMQKMAATQIRRVPVVSHDDKHKLVGIVALGDLATKMNDGEHQQEVEQLVNKVSSPSAPDRATQDTSADRQQSAGTRIMGGGADSAVSGSHATGGPRVGNGATLAVQGTGGADSAPGVIAASAGTGTTGTAGVASLGAIGVGGPAGTVSDATAGFPGGSDSVGDRMASNGGGMADAGVGLQQQVGASDDSGEQATGAGAGAAGMAEDTGRQHGRAAAGAEGTEKAKRK